MKSSNLFWSKYIVWVSAAFPLPICRFWCADSSLRQHRLFDAHEAFCYSDLPYDLVLGRDWLFFCREPYHTPPLISPPAQLALAIGLQLLSVYLAIWHLIKCYGCRHSTPYGYAIASFGTSILPENLIGCARLYDYYTNGISEGAYSHEAHVVLSEVLAPTAGTTLTKSAPSLMDLIHEVNVSPSEIDKDALEELLFSILTHTTSPKQSVLISVTPDLLWLVRALSLPLQTMSSLTARGAELLQPSKLPESTVATPVDDSQAGRPDDCATRYGGGLVPRVPEQRKLGLPLPEGPDARQLTQDELATLGAAIQARKGQLDNWFRNQRKKIGNANGPATRVGANAIEIFQKRNPDLIKAELTKAGYDALTETNKGDDEDDWTDETEDSAAARLKRTKSDRMRMRTRVVQGLWAEASDEEREAVGAEVLEEKRKLHEEELQREKSSAELKSTSPWELQEGIDAVDAVFSDIHKAVFKAAGWVGMSISGGPNPRMGGDLTMKVVCFGQTPAGHDFEDCCVDFNENVSKAFQEFLKIVYSEQDCRACALPAGSTDSDERQAQRILPPAPGPDSDNVKKSKSKSKSKKSPAIAEDSEERDSISSPSSPERSASGFDSELVFTTANESVLGSPSAMRETELDMGSAGDGEDDMVMFGDFDTTRDLGDDLGMSWDAPQALEVNEHGAQLWPLGMSAPQSPGTAAAIATIERGGMPNGATMAIDPLLLGVSASTNASPPSVTPSRTLPQPRPAYKGAPLAGGATINVQGFNFPVTNAAPTPPPVSQGASLDGSAYRPSFLFEAFCSSKPSPVPMTPTISRTLPPRKTPALPTPGFASITARAISKIIYPEPRNTAPSPSPFPGNDAGAPLDSIAPPGSRPQAKPVAQPKPRKAPATKKVAVASARKKEVAAGTAAKKAVVGETAKRGRGRPPKVVLADSTNAVVETTDPATPPTAPAPPAAPPAAPNPAAAEKEAKAKEAAEALAKQLEKGWIEGTDSSGATTIVFTRTRKVRVLSDGSVAKLPVVKRRAKKLSATEEALLARTKNGKRKAPEPTPRAEPSKRRKV
ncbi:hypothetical protein B0H10DRAFT_2438851 [Mycena sp. CBHHK59/15]|nr:hypothetical protein B0H10DRAFT_2438851 [Mycena sp. CBHHK59/15]